MAGDPFVAPPLSTWTVTYHRSINFIEIHLGNLSLHYYLQSSRHVCAGANEFTNHKIDIHIQNAYFPLPIFFSPKHWNIHICGESNRQHNALLLFLWGYGFISLQWRHNDHDSVSNHQPHDCLLNCLSRRRSKKTSKLRVTGLCAGNIPRTGDFPAQMASNAENISIWWRHHVLWGDGFISHYNLHGYLPQFLKWLVNTLAYSKSCINFRYLSY